MVHGSCCNENVITSIVYRTWSCDYSEAMIRWSYTMVHSSWIMIRELQRSHDQMIYVNITWCIDLLILGWCCDIIDHGPWILLAISWFMDHRSRLIYFCTLSVLLGHVGSIYIGLQDLISLFKRCIARFITSVENYQLITKTMVHDPYYLHFANRSLIG